MKRKWKIILTAMVFILVAGILTFQYLEGVQVDVHRVERGDLVDSFIDDGVLISEGERMIYSLYQAHIDRVNVEEGDEVEEDDLLVVLDTEELKYKLSELQSQLNVVNKEIEMTRETFETADENYKRIDSLYEKDYATRIELEEAEQLKKEALSGLEKLKAQRSSINAKLSALEYKIDNHRINAPISGIVADLNAEEKGIAGPQAPLMRLLKKDSLKHQMLVEARVLTRDVEEVYVGKAVEMIFDRREEDLAFSGEVKEIAAYAEEDISPLGLEEERVTITIKPELPEEVLLAPGYKVDVKFIASIAEEVLLVPRRALFTHDGEDALMVVRNDRARVQKVNIGAETRREAEVIEGIREGNLVILDPGHEDVSDGQRVYYETD